MSVKLFHSSQLERLTFMPMPWFLSVWGAVFLLIGWQCASLRWLHVGVFFAAGLFLWTLTEYFAHRFLFHLKLRSSRGQQFIFIIHGNHHADPGDRLRNMMPLVVTLPLALIIWAFLRLCIGHDGNAAFLGFGVGYFLYDLTHYAAHQVRSENRFLGYLRRHHLRHHYTSPDANYAITAVFWDAFFGTAAPRRRS